MKPSALRIERLLAKIEAELACSARARRYVWVIKYGLTRPHYKAADGKMRISFLAPRR